MTDKAKTDWKSVKILENLGVSDKVLLTGAGFTANFGTPLAKDMWYLIQNHIRSNKHLEEKSELMEAMDHYIENFDYESAYFHIMKENQSKEHQEAMHKAIVNAYKHIDNVLRNCISDKTYEVNIGKLRELFFKFFRKANGKSFYFTLNQDLFNKRILNEYHPILPDMHQKQNFTTLNTAFTDKDYILMPSKDEMIEKILHDGEDRLRYEKYFYMKLHGSQDWISSDRKQLMIIGGNKLKQISDYPLLSWYYQIFNSILSLKNRKLLIIGYGFHDDHINNVIGDAIKDHGLKIYIITPNPREDFHIRLGSDIPKRESVWIKPKKLSEVLPKDSSGTEDYRELLKEFFGLNLHS